MDLEELTRAWARWPELAPACLHLMTGRSLGLDSSGDELNLSADELRRRSDARKAARARILGLRGRARYTWGGWDREHLVFVGDASGGIGGYWLCYREPTYWERAWTQDLSHHEPLDDAAREVMGFVALQIEQDIHLAEGARCAGTPAREVAGNGHLRHLRAFLARPT